MKQAIRNFPRGDAIVQRLESDPRLETELVNNVYQALNSRYGATPDFRQREIQDFVVQTIMQFINTDMHAAAA